LRSAEPILEMRPLKDRKFNQSLPRIFADYNPGEELMKSFFNSFKTLQRLVTDESGAEVIEYALVLGLIIVATIATIGAFGTRVLARWSSANSSM
jgi:Flp pilus assembly pilin Flp